MGTKYGRAQSPRRDSIIPFTFSFISRKATESGTCHKLLCYIAKKVYVNALKCQKLECASCLARKFDPRQLEQLQLKQTPLIRCRYVLIEIVINQKNVAIGLHETSTQIHSENAESAEYALWCEIEHYFGEMQLEIFLCKHSARYCIIFVVKDSCWAGCPVSGEAELV